MYEEYFDIQETYEKKYGKNTAVLYENGSFYELYGVDNNKEKIGTIAKITEILNIQLTRRNKAIIENSRENPLMAGIPTGNLQKFKHLLLNNNYTVVFVEQITSPPNPKRAVTRIESKSMNFDVCNSDTNVLMNVFISTCIGKTKQTEWNVGLSLIDVTTGWNGVYEIPFHFSTQEKKDEITRYIQMYNPVETVIYVEHEPETDKVTKEALNKEFDFRNKMFHLYLDELPPEITKIKYQNELLKIVFPNTGLLSPIEFINLERLYYGLISYILLLDFAKSHSPQLISKISVPEIFTNTQDFLLETNAVTQLNVLNEATPQHSLFNIVNFTSTTMGRRLLKERLCRPTIKTDTLTKRYDMVQFLIDNRSILDKIHKHLNEVVDIERLHRKLSLGNLNPCDFVHLNTAYCNFITLIELHHKMQEYLGFKELDINDLKSFQEDYNQLWQVEEMSKYLLNNIYSSFYKRGIHAEIDSLEDSLQFNRNALDAIARRLSEYLDNSKGDMIKVENNERDGYFLTCTAKRSDLLKEKFKNTMHANITVQVDNQQIVLKPKELVYKIQGTSAKITDAFIEKCSHQIIANLNRLKDTIKEKYIYNSTEIWNKYSEMLRKLTRCIGELDFIKSAAKCAIEYHYSRPKIQEYKTQKCPDGKSYLVAKEIRHPIIERISETTYITNDIELGKDKDGLLIFGINAVGKSSLMKAVGTNLVLAQCGYYVASSDFTFWPYKNILTRISGDDNLFRGLSTFAVEMMELKSILNHSNENSLVLGDEICHGTEQVSGQAIVSATILKLADVNASFLFATHLHSISHMERIKKLDNVRMVHLEVQIERIRAADGSIQNKLTYNRKLKEGAGGSMYGIEVAEYIIHNRDFIKLANEIRNEIIEEDEKLLPYRTSKYNSSLIVHKCEICGEKAEDTHHINFQCHADQDKFIGHIARDSLSNLVPLCKKCHMTVHHPVNGIQYFIEGWFATTNGKQLKYRAETVGKKKSIKIDKAKVK